MTEKRADPARMKTLLIHVVIGSRPERDPKLALGEANSLVSALGVELARSDIVTLMKPDAGMLFGKGKREEIKEYVEKNHIDLIVVNGKVSPIQQRNLERFFKAKVLDRTALILEIFGERAQTREGVLQVDLAHLEYQRSRLVRSWTHLERQRGGSGFMGGPGETQIESDRRAIDDAILRLKRQLKKVAKTRDLHRAARQRRPYPTIALVGYTNAGKSTIFNALTGADVMAKDMVFATLDPTMRALELDNEVAILSDTVGFITDLPTQLVAAFRSTLEEVLDADLLVHVRDIAHPESEEQAQDVLKILSELGTSDTQMSSMIEVWNKADLLSEEERQHLLPLRRDFEPTLTSAMTGDGLVELKDKMQKLISPSMIEEQISLSLSDGRQRAWLFERKLITDERIDGNTSHLNVKWSAPDKNRFYARFPSLRIG
jgi:GTP-binding protein HflX